MNWFIQLHFDWARVFYLLDVGLIVYISTQLILFTILKLEWAETYWKPDGSGYTKGSTVPNRRRCIRRIVIAVIFIILSTLLQCYFRQCYFHSHMVGI